MWLGLGSNLGDREGTIRSAIASLAAILGNIAESSLWETKARYFEAQPDFLNMAVRGRTSLRPRDLLARIHEIEKAHGRLRDADLPKGPRTLDIDILLFGDAIIAEPDLIIPHPGLRERKFALLPLLELDADLLDPVSGRKYAEYLRELPAQGIYPWRPRRYDALYPQ